MSKDETAAALIRLLLKRTTKKNLHATVKELIDIAYVNPNFIDALFRAENMAKYHAEIEAIK